MNQPSLLWLFISIPLVGMFVGVFGVYWASMGAEYGLPQGQENLTTFDKVQEINADLENIKDRTTTIKEDPGIVDRIGNFFSNAYSILSTIPKSFDIIGDFVNQAIFKIPMGNSGIIIAVSLQTIFISVIIIGIVLAILLKVNT